MNRQNVLTVGELSRLQRTLRGRFLREDPENLQDVGFGVALRGGRVDRRRGLTACFFARRKRTPRRRQATIPPSVRLRLLRDGRIETVQLSTDVVELPAAVPIGPVFDGPGAGPALAGTVVAWKERSGRGSRNCCGVLTVGHAFRGRRRPLLRFRDAVSGNDFNGRLLVRSRQPSPVDAAVVQVHAEDLVENNWLAAELSPRGMIDLDRAGAVKVVDVRQLAGIAVSGHGFCGTAWNRPVPRTLRFHAYLPTLRCPPLGVLRHVVSARAAGDRPFRPGTSGSLWDLDTLPAALQVAAVPREYRLGFAQALAVSVTWARRAVEAHSDSIAGSFRVIGAVER